MMMSGVLKIYFVTLKISAVTETYGMRFVKSGKRLKIIG